jgi:hypothetical protein
MTKIQTIIYSIVAVIFVLSARGQGSFQNLDFEAATVSQTQAFNFVQTSDALPGWAVCYGTAETQNYILFDTFIVGAPQVDLLDANNGGIDGDFSVFIQGGNVVGAGIGNVSATDAIISQTGLVPAGAQSILFKAQSGTDSLLMSLDGQNIPFVALATGANYILYGGDISALANQFSQPLELEFTAEGIGTGWNIDSIEFLSQPVPEPSTWALLITGSGLLVFFRRPAKWRNNHAGVDNHRRIRQLS